MVKIDRLGNNLREGDIVLRAKHSFLCYHKVLGFTKKSIVLSVEKRTRGYRNSKWVIDTERREDLSLHNSRIYLDRWHLSRGIIKV